MTPDLAALGWDERWAERARTLGVPVAAVARVAAVDREQLLLLDTDGAFRARLSGRFRFGSTSPEERPCVGDWVWVERSAGDRRGRVCGLLPRCTALRRRAAGEIVEHQMIAANVDVVIVVQSCHYDFNLKRLERYLVVAWDGGAAACVLLTKTDLVAPEVVAAQVAQIESAGLEVPVLTLSNVSGEGRVELERLLEPGRTYCFVGSSGVGKSTLVNALLGREILATRGVSGTGEGRHTTVRRELFVLASGAMVIDNHGMRELGVLGDGDGLDASHADIAERAGHCRFRDCTHTGEPGCAVREALESGAIDAGHYENFLKLRKESAFARLSHVERRWKDRDFGRLVRSIKKDLQEE